MKVKDIEEIYACAINWIKEAGERITQSFQTTLNIETKSNANDLVTNIDKETEQFFISKIKEKFPTHRVLGEEGIGDALEELSGLVWIIDPIDGTTNFVHQQRDFAISIGIYKDGVGMVGLIYDVVRKELYHAIKGKGAYMNSTPLTKLQKVSVSEAIIGLNATWVTRNRRIDPSILSALVTDVRGTRSYGSAALEMANVAAGRLDAYITLRLSPWDFAAGLILIEEVGGKSSTLKGEPIKLLEQNTILISKPGLNDLILNYYLKDKL